MGSGVAVSLEQLERIKAPEGEHWAPTSPAKIKKYLLTCDHVVRGFDSDTGKWNARLEEILCWGPKSRYLHWPVADHRRLSGQADAIGAHRAELQLAPFPKLDAVPSEDATPVNDWVLLEVADGPAGEFNHMPAVETWREIGEDERGLSVIGYPGGALTWNNNQEVISHRSTQFGVKRLAPGVLVLTGVDETRPGMSGGGVFARRGALVALHREVNDGAMERHAVPVAAIRDWLEERGMRPAPAPASDGGRKADSITQFWSKPKILGFLLLAALLAGTLIFWWSVPPGITMSYCLKAQGGEDPPGRRGEVLMKPVAGLKVEIVPDNWDLPNAAPVITDVNGMACFRFQLPRDLGGSRRLPFNVRCLNAPGVLSTLSPLILEPYGIAPAEWKHSSADLARYKEPAGEGDNRVADSVSVLSVRTLVAQQISSEVGKSSDAPEQPTPTQVAEASAKLRLSPKQAQASLSAWASVLEDSNPVLAISHVTGPDAAAIQRVAAAVGIYHQSEPNGSVFQATGLAIAQRAVLVPGFGVSSDAAERWIEFGESIGGTFRRVTLGRILWCGGSGNESLCLLEAEGELPAPPVIGKISPNEQLRDREIYVIGIPGEAGTASDELHSLFPIGQLTAMFGKILGRAAEPSNTILYDAWTTGGTAGGPLVDRKSNTVIGIHLGGSFKGRILKENFAVSFAALLEDTSFATALIASNTRLEPMIVEHVYAMVANGRSPELFGGNPVFYQSPAIPNVAATTPDDSLEQHKRGSTRTRGGDLANMIGVEAPPGPHAEFKFEVADQGHGRTVFFAWKPGEAKQSFAGLTLEDLSSQEAPPDVLRLATANPLTDGYNPNFLGVSIPLPQSDEGEGQAGSNVPLDYVHYSVVMSKQRRVARFAAANHDRRLLVEVPRTRDRWMRDPRLPEHFQPSEAPLQSSNLDKGQLISRLALTWGPPEVATLASLSAFYLPNATLQHADLNRRTWADLERLVYEKLDPNSQRVSVFAGPVEDPADIWYLGSPIPRRFWLVAAYENETNPGCPTVHAFLAEQYRPGAGSEPDEWLPIDESAKELAIEEIERAARLRFQLPKNAVCAPR